MKSISSISTRHKHDACTELILLHKENATLRNKLKEIGKSLNEMIEKKELLKKEKVTVPVNPEEELKKAKKMIEIYK